MALDVTGLIILVLFFIRGYTRGLVVAAFSVLAILLGIVCALKLSQAFATWLLAHNYVTSGWAPLLSYLILFTGVVLLVRLAAKLIQKALEGMMLGTVNKLAGGLLYTFMGAVLWSTLLWIGGHMGIISAETIAQSKTYSILAALAPWLFAHIGVVLPFARDVFSNLQEFFDGLQKG